MKQRKSKIKCAIHIVILMLLVLLILAPIYISVYFENETIDELIFYLTRGAVNGDLRMYLTAIRAYFPFFAILLFILIALFYNVMIDKKIILEIKNFKFQIYPVNFIRNHRIIFTIILAIIATVIAFVKLQFMRYFQNNVVESTFIEDNYIMNQDDIVFKEKRNLIYIIAESLENTFLTKEQGGNWDYEVTPELYEILEDAESVSFSVNEKESGLSAQYGAHWTTASIVSNYTGLPLKIPIQGNSYHSKNFMNGAYALGDILKDNGYYNELISGANTSFGGVKEFFTRHGNYNIIDSKTLKKNDLTKKKDDEGPWGLNDNYVFESAKKRLEVISKNEKPFNLSIITIDTHPHDGYVGSYTVDKYKTQYENVYATESKLIKDFIDWVKDQDFYKNTTIVVVGDHLNMQTKYFGSEENNRYIYNAIINSSVSTDNTKNRIALPMDMFPTTLAAMGAEIKGDRLALGTNLFSNIPTLAEKYGLEELNKDLEKKSSFYNINILGSDYFYLKLRN